jgi:hypothetical protein
MIASANGHHNTVDLLLKFQADKLAARGQGLFNNHKKSLSQNNRKGFNKNLFI